MVNYRIQSSHSPISVQALDEPDFKSIRDLLEPVSKLYPNFDTWFDFRFRRNFKSGERLVLSATYGSRIVGIALLKKADNEHKICTLFVKEEYREQGIGQNLLSSAIDILKDNNIGISVSEERHLALKAILKANHFSLVSEKIGCYREQVTEYFYELDK